MQIHAAKYNTLTQEIRPWYTCTSLYTIFLSYTCVFSMCVSKCQFNVLVCSRFTICIIECRLSLIYMYCFFLIAKRVSIYRYLQLIKDQTVGCLSNIKWTFEYKIFSMYACICNSKDNFVVWFCHIFKQSRGLSNMNNWTVIIM